jgi:hypothetical protein
MYQFGIVGSEWQSSVRLSQRRRSRKTAQMSERIAGKNTTQPITTSNSAGYQINGIYNQNIILN